MWLCRNQELQHKPPGHVLAAAWLPVTLRSNKSPCLQERVVSKGGGQCGGGGPITQILWVRRGPGETGGCGGVRCGAAGPDPKGADR